MFGIGLALRVSSPASAAAGPIQAPLEYSCQFFASTCTVYNGRGDLVRTLTSADGISNPQGTQVGRTGNWFVANSGQNDVLVFNAGATKTLAYLSNLGIPVDVSTHGDVIAVSIQAGPGVVVFKNYSQGVTLTDDRAVYAAGVAFDRHGNCYWSFNDGTGVGRVDEFTGCAGSPKDLGLSLGYATGIAFDPAGNLLVNDEFAGTYVCAGVSSCTVKYTGFLQPLMLNFNENGTRFIEADGTGTVSELAYPSGAVVFKIATGTIASGAAIYPSDAL